MKYRSRLKDHFVLFSVCILVISGCNKDNVLPPPPSSFSAGINGTPGIGWSVNTYSNASSGFIEIDAHSNDANHEEILLDIYHVTGPGNYALVSPPVIGNLSSGNCIIGLGAAQVDYTTDMNHIGSVTFTKVDPTSKLLSGTFYFTATEPSNLGTGTVSVTNGIFSNIPWH